MSEIVYVYNYGDVEFIDICAYEQVCIKPKQYQVMVLGKALFFVGDGTATDDIRVAFRRSDGKPKLQIYGRIEDIPTFKPMEIQVKPVVVEEKQVESVSVVEEKIEVEETITVDDTIQTGKLAGQKWDDALNPEKFNVLYWKIAVGVLKGIPDERKAQIKSLLDAAREAQDGGNS
ncbi:hypothetical protein KKC67_03430 [Patescibacteria group bacterium]|nr:hypothetical protein [Patescibacteria group bacterium]MBU0879859.1 hypothetical protein [Patescibacteria group bacterium]MBU1992031.1 hypothetical protein [Patescibacteria group bacterium]MBU2266470.1 hypothetical protein [Candidatus Omnitrophota bacterium]